MTIAGSLGTFPSGWRPHESLDRPNFAHDRYGSESLEPIPDIPMSDPIADAIVWAGMERAEVRLTTIAPGKAEAQT